MIIYIYVFILGTVFASFIDLYVSRSLREESIVSPRSHCETCGHTLKWYELIPIVSYTLQKGKCRACNKKIGKDAIISEVITGILFVVVYFVYGFSYDTLLGFVIVLALVSIYLSDFKCLVILDSTILVATILSYIIIFLDLGIRGIYKSFLYGVFAFVFLFIVKILGDAAFKRESLGGGDVKLAFLMGSILPYNMFLIAILFGSLIALPYAFIQSSKTKRKEFAYGPFLVSGLFIVFLLKKPITEFMSMLFS